MRLLAGIGVVGALLLASSVAAVAKGPPTGSGGGPGSGSHGGGSGNGGGSSTPTGNDVSYPQCGHRLPSSPAFAIVGLNGGLANDLNPCFQTQLSWAVTSAVGGTTQGPHQLYLNTADPGNMYNGAPVADWPQSGTSTQYGSCTTVNVTTSSGTYIVGANSDACAYEYGYERAAQDVAWLSAAASALAGQSPTVPGAASSYPWWLDVETVNSWQVDTTMNAADLQGMIQALYDRGATSVGVYSTASQWNQIVGASTSGSLVGLDDWIPGGSSLSDAQASCSVASFTGGTIAITQWKGHPDNDYAC